MDKTEATDETQAALFEVQLEWGPVESVPVRPVNQFAAVVGAPAHTGTPDGMYLVMGHVSTPLVSGSPEEVRRRLQEMGPLKITVEGRYLMTRDRLQELIGVLTEAAAKYDDTGGAKQGPFRRRLPPRVPFGSAPAKVEE